MAVDTDERCVAREAAAGGAAKRAYIRGTFSAIAPRYDLLNHLLSLNIDRRWRQRAIDALPWRERPSGTYLDLCAGTLDAGASLSARPGFAGFIAAVDFAEPMLRAGRAKTEARRVAPLAADALELPLRDGSMDAAIVAFGVRNLGDLDAGLREARRVIAPGGRLVILEFSTPRLPAVRALYELYLHRLLPFVGRVVSGHPTAYRYLPESVARFPGADELARRMERAGFVRVRWEALTLGVAAVHVGETSQ